MKVTGISVYRMILPLQHPYSLSGGRLHFDQLDTTLVCLQTDEGVVGWGEGCPWGSTYLPAFAAGLRAGIEELAPVVLGANPLRHDDVNRLMDMALPGHPYVKSAFDIACYDIAGKAFGIPVADLLGGMIDEVVTVQSSIPTGAPDQMIRSIEMARARGYRVHSAKIGSSVADDIARIDAIAGARVTGESITFDANRAWRADEAIRVMHATEGVDAYFEEPCDTYVESLRVRRRTRQPILLDESMKSYQDVLRAVGDEACEGIGLKLNRVGGLTKARRIRDLCVESGLRMNIEETGGTALADTAAVHLAQSTPASHRKATWLCHEMLSTDPIVGGARNAGGTTSVPEAHGLGAHPDPSLIGDPVAVYR